MRLEYKYLKPFMFIQVLSSVALVPWNSDQVSVSLGVDADAGAVVGRADEFDAGSFVEAFNFLEVVFFCCWYARLSFVTL